MADVQKAFRILDQYFGTVSPEQYVKDLRRANPGMPLPCDTSRKKS